MSWKMMYKLSLGILICMTAISVTAMAQNRTHTVRSGETLFSIARQFDVTVQNLKEWNDLKTNELNVGQTLIIEQKKAADEPLIHTVQAQETLFSISKKYGVNISEIKAWNDLSDNNLQVGRELVIHLEKTSTGAGENTGRNSIVVDNNTENNTYYTVKSGDTLYQIAREHNMAIDELKQLNDLSSNTLSIGQRLTVKATSAPPSVAESATESSPQGKFVIYQARERQSLNELLNRFKMTKAEFTALNPDFSSDDVQRNQKVTVLAPPTKTYDNPYLTDSGLKNLGETTVAKYSDTEKGKTTTSGELYNPGELTAAHSNIAMGTIMFIQNSHNQKGVYVRINDRISGKGLKLSGAAWQALDFSSSSPSVKIFQDQ